MMTIKYDGGPAFARVCDKHFHDGQTGMSLRDYFAGQAISGAAIDISSQSRYSAKYISGFAYEIADRMLAQRDYIKQEDE